MLLETPWVRRHSRQPRHSRKPVEPRIERQDSLNAVLFHHSQMNCIMRGEALVAKDNLFGALDNGPVNRQDLVHHPQKRVEGGLDVVAAIDGDVAMQDQYS
jgi:hypothetical protein